MTACMLRFKRWHHPTKGTLRLYLADEDVAWAVSRTVDAVYGDDNSDALVTPEIRVWLSGRNPERSRSPLWWINLRGDQDPDGVVTETFSTTLKRVLSEKLPLAGDIGWDDLVSALEHDGCIVNQDSSAGQRSHAPSIESDHTNPVHSASPERGTVTVTAGKRESQAMIDHLQAVGALHIVQDHEQWADFRCLNARGDELLIVRQRLKPDDPNPAQWLFRHAEHLSFLAATNDHRILGLILIEGAEAFDPQQRQNLSGFDGALMYVAACEQVSVITSASLAHSGDLVGRALAQFLKSADVGLPSPAKRSETLLDHKLRCLEAIPGLSRTLAEALLARFGSIRAIAQASRLQLEATEGIGPRRASEIQRVLQHGHDRWQ